MPISLKKHLDSEYLYLDLRGLSSMEMSKVTMDLSNMISLAEDNSLRLIINVKGETLTLSGYSIIKVIAKQAQRKIRDTAFLGINKNRTVFFNMYKKFTGSRAIMAQSLEEALNHVFSDK